MRVYWTLKSIPELQQLEPAERRKRWRKMYHRSLLRREGIAGFATLFVFIFLANHVPGLFGLSAGPWKAVTGLATCGLGCLVAGQIWANGVRRELRRDDYSTSSHHC